jgi:hypothetical protein
MMSWRSHLKIHPACELFPPMSPAELRELGEDIKKDGLNQSFIVWSLADRQTEELDLFLLDGRNRLDAMELAGLGKLTGCTPLNNGTIKLGNRWLPDGQQVVRLLAMNESHKRNGKPNVYPAPDPYAYAISANIKCRRPSPGICLRRFRNPRCGAVSL